MVRYPGHSQGLGTPSVNPQLMAIWIGSFQKSEPGTTTFQLISYKFNEKVFFGVFPIPTPGISLSGLSPQGILAPPILNTCLMKELHTAMPRPASPGSSSTNRPPPQGLGVAPTFRKELLCELVFESIVGARTPTPPLEDQHSKEYAMTICNKWTQFVSSDGTQ